MQRHEQLHRFLVITRSMRSVVMQTMLFLSSLSQQQYFIIPLLLCFKLSFYMRTMSCTSKKATEVCWCTEEILFCGDFVDMAMLSLRLCDEHNRYWESCLSLFSLHCRLYISSYVFAKPHEDVKILLVIGSRDSVCASIVKNVTAVLCAPLVGRTTCWVEIPTG